LERPVRTLRQATRYTMTAFTSPGELCVHGSPEGPALVPLDDGGLRIPYDAYGAGEHWYSDSPTTSPP